MPALSDWQNAMEIGNWKGFLTGLRPVKCSGLPGALRGSHYSRLHLWKGAGTPEAKHNNWMLLLLAVMISGTLFYCLMPGTGALLRQYLPRRSLSILVEEGPTGCSEVWVAVPDNQKGNFWLEESILNSNIKGVCEYRDASDYGYLYDFLVSNGENIGTVLNISYTPDQDTTILFRTFPTAGSVQIRHGDVEEKIDLTSTEDGIVTVQIGRSFLEKALWSGLWVVCFFAATIVLLILLHKSRWLLEYMAQPEAVHSRSTRNTSMDLVRAVAAFLVVAVHSFLASGYYNAPLSGEKMVFLTFARWIALCCVPLFMVLSGYLCKERDLSWKSYFSLTSIMLTFFFITLIRVIFLEKIVWRQTITLRSLVAELIGMDLSWYVEMYIGLALLIPFLNLIWKHTTRQQKNILIVTLVSLTALGSITNSILPVYWICLYPINYYFLGAYLKDYPVVAKKSKMLIMFAGVIALETIFTCTNNWNQPFDWGIFGGYQSANNALPVVMSTLLLFIILSNVQIHNQIICRILKNISENSLGIYIASVSIVDNLVYPKLQSVFLTPQDFMVIQVPAILISFTASLCIANLVNLLVKPLVGRLLKRCAN